MNYVYNIYSASVLKGFTLYVRTWIALNVGSGEDFDTIFFYCAFPQRPCTAEEMFVPDVPQSWVVLPIQSLIL